MIQRILHFSAAALAVLFLLSSCAKEVTRSSEDTQNELLEAYIHTTYGSARPAKSEMGYYYIMLKQGTGTVKPIDEDWVSYDYVAKTPDGTVSLSSITTAELAKAYGLYQDTIYFTPNYYPIGQYNMIASGIQDAIKNLMKEGDSIRLIMIPKIGPSMSIGTPIDSYAPVIVDVALHKVVPKPLDWDKEQVQNFRVANYPTLGITDSVRSDLYIYPKPASFEPINKEGDTVKLFYSGKYLDGFLFDSIIKDTLKAHGHSDGYYQEIKALKKDTMTLVIGDIAKKGGAKGFEEAVKYMNLGDKVKTFFTATPWGYGLGTLASSETTIKPHAPLFFEIELIYIGKKESTENP